MFLRSDFFGKKHSTFHQPSKFSRNSINFSLFRLQVVKSAHGHFLHCLVEGRRQNRQGRQTDGLSGWCLETQLFVDFEKLLATGCLLSALLVELHNRPNFHIFRGNRNNCWMSDFNLIQRFFCFTFAMVAVVIRSTFRVNDSFVPSYQEYGAF